MGDGKVKISATGVTPWPTNQGSTSGGLNQSASGQPTATTSGEKPAGSS